MSTRKCARTGTAELVDYWAGDLPEGDASSLEEHLFVCNDCAQHLADIESLTRALGQVIRGARFGAIVTEAVLNRLARDGVRVRTFTLSPGDVVPCAVWNDDDVMAVRLRGDFTGHRRYL